MSALLSFGRETNDAAFVEPIELPLGERFTKPCRYSLRDRERHNPFAFTPSADDMIPFGLKFGGFSNPQRLSHVRELLGPPRVAHPFITCISVNRLTATQTPNKYKWLTA